MGTGHKAALVTVGTTKFDALIRGIDRVSFLQKLVQLGFTSVLVQQGQGDYSVQYINRKQVPGITVRVEEYLSNLAAEIERASLVVSHAGAGSIFESLLFKVPLVVVPNPILMGNHQVELADLMDELQHAVSCTVDTIEPAMEEVFKRQLVPYTPGNSTSIADAISSLFP